MWSAHWTDPDQVIRALTGIIYCATLHTGETFHPVHGNTPSYCYQIECFILCTVGTGIAFGKMGFLAQWIRWGYMLMMMI